MSYQDWPPDSPQRAFVEGALRAGGVMHSQAWLEGQAEGRYGPPILDDDQPITEDWLRGEGLNRAWGKFILQTPRGAMEVSRSQNLGYWLAEVIPFPCRMLLRTRGQLRALLTAIYGDSR